MSDKQLYLLIAIICIAPIPNAFWANIVIGALATAAWALLSLKEIWK
jgi:hypothetical protein